MSSKAVVKPDASDERVGDGVDGLELVSLFIDD